MSFLSDYLSYATENEAPEMFHVWAGYVCLSAAISRRVWFTNGRVAIYPNLYVLLIGEAGNGKSFALGEAKQVLTEVTSWEIPMSGSIETPEGMWAFMNGNDKANPPIPSPVAFNTPWPDKISRLVHPMTIFANEFVNFISINQAGWVSALNDIFDTSNYKYRTKNKGTDNLIGPYIVVFGAITTDVSHTLQKANIIGTGFARRTIMQYGKRDVSHPRAFMEFTESHKAARTRCVRYLESLAGVRGDFFMPQDARDYYETWYNDHTVNAEKRSTPQTIGWARSKPDQVIKLAMLTSLSESTELVINVSHIKQALHYLGVMEKTLYQVFGGAGRNELSAVAQKMFEYVESRGEPISRKILKGQFWQECRPPNDFDQCMEFLTSTGKLIEWANPQSGAVIATPEVRSKFASAPSDQTTTLPAPVVLNGLRPVTSHEADPSFELELPLPEMFVGDPSDFEPPV